MFKKFKLELSLKVNLKKQIIPFEFKLNSKVRRCYECTSVLQISKCALVLPFWQARFLRKMTSKEIENNYLYLIKWEKGGKSRETVRLQRNI